MLEAVIVCDKYSDFLAATLPTNKSIFDKLVVVSSWEDQQTKRICEYHNVLLIRTDRLESRYGRFKKAAGINDGFKQLSMSDWVMHLDADIVLPPLTRQILEQANLDPTMIYGCDRLMVPNAAEWAKFQTTPKLLHENGTWVHTANSGFDLGVRVMAPHGEGWLPIGFLQLFNPKKSGITEYPGEDHPQAGRTDMLFALKWPRAKRGFIPELIVMHLESEPANLLKMGANWNGRKTRPFCPVDPPDDGGSY